jgi:aminocarboxymuconate-semialdehyde decarboxylase
MDAQKIQAGVLSLTAPSVTGWNGSARRDMARRVNEYAAGLMQNRPDRFGNFATLPLPDIDGTLQEIANAFDLLNADGVVLMTNYDGRYLGDPMFEPLWAELNRRHATVFIHPAKPTIQTIDGIPSPIVDYPFDTTRCAVHMVLNGVLSRYSDCAIILSHAGGFVPYAANRFAELAAAVRNDVSSAEAVLEGLRRFHFDTALSTGPSALLGLKAFVGTDRILFGSDFPYAPAVVGTHFTRRLDSSGQLSTCEKDQINNGNASILFPRFNV